MTEEYIIVATNFRLKLRQERVKRKGLSFDTPVGISIRKCYEVYPKVLSIKTKVNTIWRMLNTCG